MLAYRRNGSAWVKDTTLKSPLDENQRIEKPMGVQAVFVNGTFVIGVGEDDWDPKLPTPDETSSDAALNAIKAKCGSRTRALTISTRNGE